ncbi:MAG: hypothetical protein IJK73_08155 [Bacteroidales bacterium]|nr:hypothetical protein [Bacteroidales bacterium]
MKLIVLAFCPMFNHVHFLLENVDKDISGVFMKRITCAFVKEYNKDYQRKGQLFEKSFGSSSKRTVKIILGCVAYIFNNPVAGKLCRFAKEYKWNLLAYKDSRNPFSEPLKKNCCSKKLRRSIDMVDYYHSRNRYLTYNTLRIIIQGLTEKEMMQIVDYILFKYNFLSFESMEKLYGSYEKMMMAIDSCAGSEFDLEDEYGDHTCYRKMLAAVKKLGYNGQSLNFERLTEEETMNLFRLIKAMTFVPTTCVKKFLHMDP